MMTVQQKLAGLFRSEDGAQVLCHMRRDIFTARKNAGHVRERGMSAKGGCRRKGDVRERGCPRKGDVRESGPHSPQCGRGAS